MVAHSRLLKSKIPLKLRSAFGLANRFACSTYHSVSLVEFHFSARFDQDSHDLQVPFFGCQMHRGDANLVGLVQIGASNDQQLQAFLVVCVGGVVQCGEACAERK